MQVLFESRSPEAAGLREVAVHRVRFAMRRLHGLVPRTRVRMSDVNGPRGGVDKCCRMELKTDKAGTLVVTSLARDWRAALENALARAVRVLVRTWRREREPARRRGIGLTP